MPKGSFVNQLRQHSVALISLAVALSSLGYNTWRNEQTEANRNVRMAGFELLLKLGELEQVVFFRHYDMDEVRGSPRTGWAYVLTIQDLATLTGPTTVASAGQLQAAWTSNWASLGKSDAARDNLSAAIDQLRTDLLAVLRQLD